MNLANAKVAQLLIPVEDFEKGVAFYRDTLGLSLGAHERGGAERRLTPLTRMFHEPPGPE